MTDLEHSEPGVGQAPFARRRRDSGGANRSWIQTDDAGAVAVLIVALLIAAYSHRLTERHVERAWIYAAVVGLILVGRGIRLRRSITAQHAGIAAIGLVVAIAADATHLRLVGFAATVLIGFCLVLPGTSRPNPSLLKRVIPLVDETPDDPLAPFVLHSRKSYFLNAAGTAAIGYRTRFGIAVVGGDPVGDTASFPGLIAEFTAFCRNSGWRVAVLGAGEKCRDLWGGRGPGLPGLRSLAFGREVVLDVQAFHLQGHQFRNLRQAVNRSHNAGVTTEVVAESAIEEPLRLELLAVADAVDRGDHRRGFSMILDRLLTGEIPGLWLVIARDQDGAVAGFQRYGTANSGREVSLDVPCRRPDAPNGTDERMTVDMLAWARERGALHLSLSFAAFPELFDDQTRGRLRQALYRLVHLGDGLLEMESLYAFLRKFHGLGQRRFVLFKLRALFPSLAAMLTLEFGTNRPRKG